MTCSTRRGPRKIVTLVVRMWPEGPPDAPSDKKLRCEATHVQTGEVVYFRNAGDLVQYIDSLSTSLLTV